MEVVIDSNIIRPVDPAGDRFFGLESGTNGSAATVRRALVERPGLEWRRHNGAHATGLQLRPGSNAWADPWSGVAL